MARLICPKCKNEMEADEKDDPGFHAGNCEYMEYLRTRTTRPLDGNDTKMPEGVDADWDKAVTQAREQVNICAHNLETAKEHLKRCVQARKVAVAHDEALAEESAPTSNGDESDTSVHKASP
jgi:hypothetical protein